MFVLFMRHNSWPNLFYSDFKLEDIFPFRTLPSRDLADSFNDQRGKGLNQPVSIQPKNQKN